jgi:hypothetical protein
MYFLQYKEVPFYFEENGKIVTKYALLDVYDAIRTERKKRLIEEASGIARGQRVFVKVGNGKSVQSGAFEFVKLGGRVADITTYYGSERENKELGMHKNFLIKFDNPHQMALPMEEVHAKLSDFDEKGNVIFGPHLCSLRLGSFELEC